MPVVFLAALLAAAQTFTLSGAAAKSAIAVWLAGPAPVPAAGQFEMHNVNRTFTPPVLIVPQGSSVRFPNDDPFYHSIYSTDKQNGFDIGYYDTGPGKYVPFRYAGVVHVRCHIHGYMHGIIVVAGGPYAAVQNGAFSIAGLPAGKYLLHEVLSDGSESTRPVTVGPGDRTRASATRAR